MAATAQSPNVTSVEARQAAQQYLEARLKSNANNQTSSQRFVVPVIDILPSFNGSHEAKESVAKQIREACLTSGFFQITGHQVPTSAQQSVLTQAARFFKSLSPTQKAALHVQNSPYLRGWEPSDYTQVDPSKWDSPTDAGYGAAIVAETKEGFNWGYEERLDPTGGDGLYTELDGSKINGNVWPSEQDLPGFFEGVRVYYAEVLALARHLAGLFAIGLGLGEAYFEDNGMLTHPGGIARLLYYPEAKKGQTTAVSKSGKAGGDEEEIGLGAHSDYECFTILLSSTAGGLEILSPDGKWVEVEAEKGGLVVNLGDFMMRYTNGVYKSTVHRVVNRTGKERYSVPFFFSINYDQLVETLPTCISEDNPSKYPPIRAGEYVLERLRATTKDG